jgi:hypothetical protein
MIGDSDSVREELHHRVSCRINPNGEADLPPDSAAGEEFTNFSLNPGEKFLDDPVVHIYLLSDESCPGCDEAKKYYVDEIKSGGMSVVYTDSDLGADMIYQLGIIEVPVLVAKLESGNYALVEN